MANEFSVFNFKTESELLEKMSELSVELPFDKEVEVLKNEVKVGEKTLKNSFLREILLKLHTKSLRKKSCQFLRKVLQ